MKNRAYKVYKPRFAHLFLAIAIAGATTSCSKQFAAYTPDLVNAPLPEFAPTVTDQDMQQIRKDLKSGHVTSTSLLELPTTEVEKYQLDSTTRLQNTKGSFKTIRVKMYPLFHREIPAGDAILPFTAESFELENLGGLSIVSTQGRTVFESTHVLIDTTKNSISSKTDGNSVDVPLSGIYIAPKNSTIPTTIVGMKHNRNLDRFFKYFGVFSLKKETQTNDLGQKVISLTLINIISLETYLLSVVSSEIPSRWSTESEKTQEAVRAQAIAARTYALNSVASARNSTLRAWDIYPTTQSQAYYGAAMMTRSMVPLIESTQGQVLIYNGKVILATFSSNAGGYVCASQDCFAIALPYLVAKEDYPGAVDMPGGICDIPVSTLEFKRAAQSVGLWPASTTLKQIRTTQSSSQRPKAIALQFEDGSHKNLSEAHLHALRQNKWKTSSLCGSQLGNFFRTHSVTSTQIQFQRLGFGHGVGMSQWGAYVQAKEGRSAREILNFYYPGAKLEDLSPK